MKSEPTQPGNPHKLTVNQHVLPRASIQRFANPKGFVEVYIKEQGQLARLRANNALFCARRAWDQKTEAGIGKRIEDRFQVLASAIQTGDVRTIGVFEKRVVEEFFSLWRARQKFKLEGLQDIRLNGITDAPLTKDEQERLERDYVMYSIKGVMKGRLLAGVHVFGYQDRFIHENRTIDWGIARSPLSEFIVPDCFDDLMIVPVSPRIAIIADRPDSVLTQDQVAVINQQAILRSTNFFFARRLSSTLINREPYPPFARVDFDA